MKTINQIKLSLSIGVLVILIPLSGLPQSYKTFILVMLGAILIYVKVAALHAEKTKKIKKAPVNRRSQTFVESKPIEKVYPEQVIEEENIIEDGHQS